MKKLSIKSVNQSLSKHAFVFTLSALLFSFSSVSAQSGKSATDVPVEINYIGNQNSLPVFQIVLDNKTGEKVSLTLLDEVGNILYTDKLKETKYRKNIRFEEYEWKSLQVTLILTGKNVNQKQIFQISNNLRTVQDVLIAKL